MAHWEYKVLSGGKMGLGSMAMLEQFLNELGQQQWEVVSWQTDPETPLKFHGLAKRPILRDLAPQEMPAAMDKDAIAAAKEEEERERQAWIETLAREREFYAKTIEDEGVVDEDEDEERDLVGDLFDTIRPLMKRNKRGPGASGSIVYLAKKLDQTEDDLIGALAESGLELGEDESDSEPHEHGSEVFWLNTNSRGEVWINSMPKSRYKPAKKDKSGEQQKDSDAKQAAKPGPSREPPPPPQPLPEGAALLEKLKPLMRRNRDGSGLSGSMPFLSRALRHTEADLASALATLGLTVPEDPNAEPVPVEIEDGEYWLNRNDKGQVWINARQSGAGEAVAEDAAAPAAAETKTDEPAAAPEPLSAANALTLAQPHLARVGRSATASATAADVAAALGVSQASLIDALVGAGLQVPVEASEKPVTVDLDGTQFWFSRGDDELLSLNAKPIRKSRPRKRG